MSANTLIRKASSLLPSLPFEENDMLTSVLQKDKADQASKKVDNVKDGEESDFELDMDGPEDNKVGKKIAREKQIKSDFFDDISRRGKESVDEYKSVQQNSALLSMRDRLRRRAAEIEEREEAKKRQSMQHPENDNDRDSESSVESSEEEGDDDDEDDEDEVQGMVDEKKSKKKIEDEELKRVLSQEIFERQRKDKTVEFSALRLSRPLNQAIVALNYKATTPVQAAAIPVALSGVDILANAATGSGKTVAFLVPIIERLLQAGDRYAATRALILSPTRELSEQIYNVALSLTKFTDIRVCCIVGGMPMMKQASELKARPDIVVATPGRMIDHVVNTVNVGLENIEMLVLDEADRLLEMGFVEETKEIVKSCPKSRQTLLFSATLTGSVEELIHLSLRNPRKITIDSESSIVDTLTQEFIRIHNDATLLRQAIVVALCVRTFHSRTIVFTKTKQDAHRLMVIFGLCKLNAAELHGNLTQAQRTEALELFKQNKVDFLICTDLAARGIDIKGVQTVINMHLPRDLPQYIHRVGRTARAGNYGCSVSLITDAEKRLMKMIMKSAQNVVRKRVVPPTVISKYSKKIAELEPEVEDILREEGIEKQLADAEMKAAKAKNLVDHRKEILSRPAREWFQTNEEREAAKNAAPLVAGKRSRANDNADESDDEAEGAHLKKKVALDLSDVKTRADLKKKIESATAAENKAKSKEERLSYEQLKNRTAELEAELAAAKAKVKEGQKDPFRGLSRDQRRKRQFKIQEELTLREEQARLAEHEEKLAKEGKGTMTDGDVERAKVFIRTLKNPQRLAKGTKKAALNEERLVQEKKDGAGPDALLKTLKTIEANEKKARRTAIIRKFGKDDDADDADDAMDAVHVKSGVSAKHRRYMDIHSAKTFGQEISHISRFRESQQAFDRRSKIHADLDADRRKPKAKGGFKSLKRHKRR